MNVKLGVETWQGGETDLGKSSSCLIVDEESDLTSLLVGTIDPVPVASCLGHELMPGSETSCLPVVVNAGYSSWHHLGMSLDDVRRAVGAQDVAGVEASDTSQEAVAV